MEISNKKDNCKHIWLTPPLGYYKRSRYQFVTVTCVLCMETKEMLGVEIRKKRLKNCYYGGTK